MRRKPDGVGVQDSAPFSSPSKRFSGITPNDLFAPSGGHRARMMSAKFPCLLQYFVTVVWLGFVASNLHMRRGGAVHLSDQSLGAEDADFIHLPAVQRTDAVP